MGGGIAYTRGNSFVFKHWVEEPFELSPADVSTLDLPGSKKTGLLLRYRDIELVVISARPLLGDGAATKKSRIEFTGRTTEAIRKATKYFTAATTTSVSFFVGSEVERDHLLHLVELNTVVNPATQSPSLAPQTPSTLTIPPPIDLHAPVPAVPPSTSSQTPRSSDAKLAIDDGFRSLETAAVLEEQQDWAAALHAYEHAHRFFLQSCPHIPSDKASTRQLLTDKCAELTTTIATLRDRVAATSNSILPPPTLSPPPPPVPAIPAHFAPTIPPASVPTAPPQQPISPLASLSSSSTSIHPPHNELTTPSPPSQTRSVDERMYALQKFAEAQDVRRAQDQKLPIVSDLALRLAALKKETTVAPPMGTLEARLQRLRGGEPALQLSKPALSKYHEDENLSSSSEFDGFSQDDTIDEAIADVVQSDAAADVNMAALLEEAQQALACSSSTPSLPSTTTTQEEDKLVAALVKQVLDEVDAVEATDTLDPSKPTTPTDDKRNGDRQHTNVQPSNRPPTSP
ncbi:hypothetical protein DYB26_003902 [Aphanomyces astaci]|uniref:Uncharacterized protein n=1 Tax=Aphanomyces astaci TaxID=112090 RepID=A0A3R7C507_APHAT|nr:hypothetical protein DYB26_003902 [Aphanomyces astaci]